MTLFAILWLFCGVICYFISKSKGYPDNECLAQGAIGFLGGLISVAYNLFRKPYDKTGEIQVEKATALGDLGQLRRKRESGQVSNQEYDTQIADLLKKV